VAREKLQTEIRQDQIIDAALALMADRGVRGLSMAAIARRVGFAPSAIYRHFRGKDALLDAVLERVRERMHGAIAAARADADDPVEALQRLLERHMRLLHQNRAMHRVLLADDFHVGHPERRQRLLGLFAGYLDGVADVVREGQRRGRIRRDVNARSLAVLFLGLVQPASLLWVLSDGRFDVTAQARAAWPIFEQSLRAKPDAANTVPAGPKASREPR
jgi:AcrR family transcriptional regulator